MTEKRFKLFVGKNYGVQKVDGEVIFDSIISMAEADVLVDLLNDLSEENEQLKSDLGYWRTLAQSLVKGNNIGKVEMMDKEVTIDLNELEINIQKEIIFKSDLNKWIEKKMDYYEGIIEKTDGCNNVAAKGHLDMLIMLKEWIKQR